MLHGTDLINANNIVMVMVSAIKSFLPRLIGKRTVNNHLYTRLNENKWYRRERSKVRFILRKEQLVSVRDQKEGILFP